MMLLDKLGAVFASKYIERSLGNIHEEMGLYPRIARADQGKQVETRVGLAGIKAGLS